MITANMPTKVDTDRLMSLASKFNENDLIPYDDIEQAIGFEKKSNRFRSVVTSWKKRLMREKNIFLVCEPNIGYRLAPPDLRVEEAAQRVTYGRRLIMRASTLAATTDRARLSEDKLRLHDHLITLPARLRLAELTAPKELA